MNNENPLDGPAVCVPSARERTVRSLRKEGLSFREIAERIGVSSASVFYALSSNKRRRPIKAAANDNAGTSGKDSNKTTYYVPHNGGCSSLSGLVPVSLPRIRALEVESKHG